MDEKLASYARVSCIGYNCLEGKEFSKRSGSMMRRVREFFESKNTKRKKRLIDGKCFFAGFSVCQKDSTREAIKIPV